MRFHFEPPGVTKYRIGRTGPLRQGNQRMGPTRTLCRLIGLDLVRVGLGLGSDASVPFNHSSVRWVRCNISSHPEPSCIGRTRSTIVQIIRVNSIFPRAGVEAKGYRVSIKAMANPKPNPNPNPRNYAIYSNNLATTVYVRSLTVEERATLQQLDQSEYRVSRREISVTKLKKRGVRRSNVVVRLARRTTSGSDRIVVSLGTRRRLLGLGQVRGRPSDHPASSLARWSFWKYAAEQCRRVAAAELPPAPLTVEDEQALM